MRGRTEEKRMKVPSKMTQRESRKDERKNSEGFFSPPSITKSLIFFFSSSVVENPTCSWFKVVKTKPGKGNRVELHEVTACFMSQTRAHTTSDFTVTDVCPSAFKVTEKWRLHCSLGSQKRPNVLEMPTHIQ